MASKAERLVDTADDWAIILAGAKEIPRGVMMGDTSVVKEWDSSLHPRGEGGKFGDKTGTTTDFPDVAHLNDLLHAEQIKDRDLPYTNCRDYALKAILIAKGFDAKPQLVNTADDLTGTPMFRGLQDVGSYKDGVSLLPAAEQVQNYKTGDLWVGGGMYGNGTYFSHDASAAAHYGEGGANIMGALLPEANVFEVSDSSDASAPFMEMWNKLSPEMKSFTGGDLGAIAALHGYDAIHVADARYTGGITVVLNRGMMQVVK